MGRTEKGIESSVCRGTEGAQAVAVLRIEARLERGKRGAVDDDRKGLNESGDGDDGDSGLR